MYIATYVSKKLSEVQNGSEKLYCKGSFRYNVKVRVFELHFNSKHVAISSDLSSFTRLPNGRRLGLS